MRMKEIMESVWVISGVNHADFIDNLFDIIDKIFAPGQLRKHNLSSKV